MSSTSRKDISDALREAMEKEKLHTREAAAKLNLNPAYISMALNENSWDQMSKAAWSRLEEWHFYRDPISSFEIPEGEEIYVPKKPEKTLTEMFTGEMRKAKNEQSKDKTEPVTKSAAAIPEQNITRQAAPFSVNETELDPCISFADQARMKITLDIEINLIVNGQKVHVRE